MPESTAMHKNLTWIRSRRTSRCPLPQAKWISGVKVPELCSPWFGTDSPSSPWFFDSWAAGSPLRMCSSPSSICRTYFSSQCWIIMLLNIWRHGESIAASKHETLWPGGFSVLISSFRPTSTESSGKAAHADDSTSSVRAIRLHRQGTQPASAIWSCRGKGHQIWWSHQPLQGIQIPSYRGAPKGLAKRCPPLDGLLLSHIGLYDGDAAVHLAPCLCILQLLGQLLDLCIHCLKGSSAWNEAHNPRAS